jgi:hypothetical protein
LDYETQPSAQATDATQEQPQQNEGIQTRINELTAKFRQAEEANQKLAQQLMEQQAKYAAALEQQAFRAQAPAPQPPEDPLAPFKDQIDPTVAQAVQAAVNATRKQMEAQFNSIIQQQAVEQSAYAVRAEVATLPNVPKEVAQRAESLMRAWKSQGLPIVPQDAINFALGEYHRGQLLKAAPVMGYNPNAQVPPSVIPGQNPPPAAARQSLPANFDSLDYNQQNKILEQMGVGDQPL